MNPIDRHRAAFGWIVAVLLLLLPGCSAASAPEQQRIAKAQVALLTSLPIVWGEGASVRAIIAQQSEPHPLFRAMEGQMHVRAVDTLIDIADWQPKPIALLIQPRALPPADMVALDQWLRAGGRAIIITDPMLDWPSDLPFGHPQRALASGLLSPLLGHWGIELRWQPGSLAGQQAQIAGRSVPIVQAGEWAVVRAADGISCDRDGAIVMGCQIGRGSALLIADADWLHRADPIVAAEILGAMARQLRPDRSQ